MPYEQQSDPFLLLLLPSDYREAHSLLQAVTTAQMLGNFYT